MKKQNSTIYEFPLEMQREFHLLMNSKENFLKNLPNAEQVKLKTLYEQLENVWGVNRTQTLSKNLEKKYSELREIQKQIESDLEEFKMIYKEKLIDNLNLRAKELEQKTTELKTITAQKEQKLKESTAIWKKDIIERNDNLSKKKVELENYKIDLNQRTNQRLTELKATLKNWESVEKVLMKELGKLGEKKSNLNRNLEIKNDLLKIEQQKLKEESGKYTNEETIFQLNLDKEKTNLDLIFQQEQKKLETSLKLTSEQQLEKLRIEIATEFPNLPSELKKLWIEGNYSDLSRKLFMIQKENEQLNNFLTKNLGKIGFEFDAFMKKVNETII